MEREPRRRRAASASSAPKTSGRPARRAVGSRVGLRRAEGANAPAAPQRPAAAKAGHARPPQRHPAQTPPPRTAAGHTSAPAAQAGHRVTKVERRRQRRRRALLGFLLVAAVLVVGLVLTFRLLFKVREFRIEDLDGNTPADTGIYAEEDIIGLLALEPGDDLLGFSTQEKTRQLAGQLPYLDTVQVHIRLPGTVVVKLRPAQERFAVQLAGGDWLILSEQRKILRTAGELPDGLIALAAPLPADLPTVAGQYLDLQSYNSLEDSASSAAAPEAADGDAANTLLAQMLEELTEKGLLAGTTALSLEDLSELAFTYEDRVTVQLGTANSLSDKLYIAARALLDVEGEGLGASDRGTLEFFQNASGELRAYFHPYDPNAAAPGTDDTEGEGEGGEDEAGEGDSDGEGDTGEDAPPSPAPQGGEGGAEN